MKSTFFLIVNKRKLKRDLLKTYFDNSDQTILTYKLQLSSDKLEISSSSTKKDIVLRKMTDCYIFFYTSKYEGIYITIKNLFDDRE